MPIHKMSFEDGVFTAKTVGYVDNVDGRMWSNALRNYAKNDLHALVALIDMTEADRICPTVVKAIAEVARVSNLNAIAIILDSSMASQNSRIVDKLAEVPNVRVVYSADEARRYVRSRLNQSSLGSSAYAGTLVAPAFSYRLAYGA